VKKRYWIAGALGVAGAGLAVKLLRRPDDVVWDEHAGALHHAEHSRFVDVDGVRVHYQEAGAIDAPAVLLLHGFTASNFVWKEVLLPLADAGFRVVAPDLVGFGFSGKPRGGEYTIDAQARVVVGLMDALGIGRASLVGSSYGGAVAATCALDYPERVERLVLVDAVINDHAKRRPLLRLAASPVLGDLLSPLMLGSRRLVRSQLTRGYAPENRHLFDEERAAAHHRPLVAAGTQRAALATLRRWHANRVEEEAHRITHPVLLVWGEADHETPLAHGRVLNRALPDSRLRIFRRCGHMPMEERPREFVEVVAQFLSEEKREPGALSAKA
jgi:pimeloyl-ACP methyl ester carboxylesterase